MPDDDTGLSFHLIRSPRYETFHADGVFSSPTPRGFAHITFYSERSAIPQMLQLDPSGDVVSSGKQGIVWELHAGFIMDKQSLESLQESINELLKEIDDEPDDN